jgi:hypothetical protein
MGILKNMLCRLFSPRMHHFIRDMAGVAARTAEQVGAIRQMDANLQSVWLEWVCLLPGDYFEALFVKPNQWNEQLLKVFVNASNLDGKECFIITQAFLLSIAEQSPAFKRYVGIHSVGEIVGLLLDNLGHGSQLRRELDAFRHAQSTERSAEDSMCNFAYITRILQSLYGDDGYALETTWALSRSPELLFGLTIYSHEMLMSALRVSDMAIKDTGGGPPDMLRRM